MNKLLYLAGVLVSLLALAAPCNAASPVLLTGPAGVTVTADEVDAEATQRLPADVRPQALKDPKNVATLATDIALRRVLAVQAMEAGLDKDPAIALKLALARERVLSEARLTQIEGQGPDRAALEKLAQTEYRAQPEKFATPEQVRVRHILIDSRTCEAEKLAAQVLEQARAPGADFAALAQQYSQDPGSAKRGGDLGFFGRGRMAPEFEKAAFAMAKPGEISGPVRTEFGLHIIRFEERRASGPRPFDEVREAIIREIAQRDARNRRVRATDPIGSTLTLDPSAIETYARQPR